jgi:uncharacterized protein YcaQ
VSVTTTTLATVGVTHGLSAQQARRIAVRAQLLAEPRPTDLLDTVRHLTLVQADPTAAVAPSAELVMWSRLGSGHRQGELAEAVAAGQLVELLGRLRPAEDLALYRAEMAAWPGVGELVEWQVAQRDWVAANDDCRKDILEKLHDEGPLPSRDLPDTTLVPWESSGWNNDRNVRMLLGLMVRRGEVAVAGREGRDVLWDLAERVYPDVEPVPLAEALRIRNERRLHSLGIARARAQKTPDEPDDLGPVGEPARIKGVRGTWRLDAAYLEGDFAPRTVLLSALDRLVFDRKRMVDLFGFDYQLEMYKPAAKRRWGYWAMPILDGDQLVGKLDATAERDAGVLRVDAVHEDGTWSRRLRRDVDREIEALADWLGLVVARP